MQENCDAILKRQRNFTRIQGTAMIRSPSRSDHQSARRKFFKTTGAALASLGLSNPALAETKARPIRVGIAGGGSFGNQFHHFKDHPDCEVLAVTDLRPLRRARLMKTYRCEKAYRSLEEMVEDRRLDAVAIFTDGNLHVDHVVKSMKCGKHVLSAVPAAWGSYEQADLLYDTVKSSGLTYMMAETSFFSDFTISARKFSREGRFGELYLFESAYQHPGLEKLYFENGSDGPPWEKGRKTWRYGFPPMFYPTHNIGYFTGVTEERLVEVTCTGYGDDSPILKDNDYGNPFWNCYGQFVSDKGHVARIDVCWKGPVMPGHPTRWTGTSMSFYGNNHPGTALLPPTLVYHKDRLAKDVSGYEHQKNSTEPFVQEDWYRTEMLPEPLRVKGGHCNSHPFIIHEFIDALRKGRRPAVHVAEALAYTVPGIVAHQSALKGGERMKIRHYDPL